MIYSVKQFTLQRLVMIVFEKNMKFPILLDIYGALLTDRKSELLDMYYNEDMSLAEISEITGISRQGVRDSVKKAEGDLLRFEEKLGFAGRSDKTDRMIDAARELLSKIGEDSVEADRKTAQDVIRILEDISADR